MGDNLLKNAEKLDEILNHIRSQLDFLCESAKYQNTILKKIYEQTCDDEIN